MQRPVDALIVGGGIAGSTAAIRLAQAGVAVTLLERSSGAHNKVCGEFISTEAIRYLSQCGVSLANLGALELHTMRFTFGGWTVEQPLPFPAYSLSRYVLDEHLLQVAASAGVDVRRNSTVSSMLHRDGAWYAHLQEETISAPHAFLATGKHDLKGLPRPEGSHAGLLGLKMYYRLSPQQHQELGHAVDLSLFPGGYAGLQPIEGGAANLCLLVRAERFRALGSSWQELVRHIAHSSPHLAERLAGATELLPKPLAAFHIPYGHVQQTTEDGLWRVGDQSAVIPSFCGDGMAIALHSSAIAVQRFLLGDRSAAYQAALSRHVKSRLYFATQLSKLMVGFPCTAQVVRLFPKMLRHIAVMTRIPEEALVA